MEKEKKCVQCGSKNHLIELQNGKYGCIDCLNGLGKEQNQIKTNIINYLETDFNMTNPLHQANCLLAIGTEILYENNLLDEDMTKSIEETYERMFGKE